MSAWVEYDGDFDGTYRVLSRTTEHMYLLLEGNLVGDEFHTGAKPFWHWEWQAWPIDSWERGVPQNPPTDVWYRCTKHYVARGTRSMNPEEAMALADGFAAVWETVAGL